MGHFLNQRVSPWICVPPDELDFSSQFSLFSVCSMAPEEKSHPSPPRGSPSCRRLSPTVVPRPFRTRTRRTCRCLPWTTRGFRSRLRSRSGCCWPRSQRSVSSQAAADVTGRNRCEVLSLRMQVSAQKGDGHPLVQIGAFAPILNCQMKTY